MKKLLFLTLTVVSAQAVAQNTEKNGTIYKQHPYIETVKASTALSMKIDMDGLSALYADTAKFFDCTEPKIISFADEKKNWQDTWKKWDTTDMRMDAAPEGLEYNNGMFKVISRWNVTMVNKKTKKTARFVVVQFDEFNKDGKITFESVYYDSGSIDEAEPD